LLDGDAQRADLRAHQEAGHDRAALGAHGVGRAVDAGVGPVGRAEGVVHVDVGQRGEVGPQLRVVLLLARVEAGVLQHEDVARLQRGGGGLDLVAHDGGDELHRPADDLFQLPGHRGHAKLAVFGRLGPPQVRGQDEGRAVVEQIVERRQRGADARVVGDGDGGVGVFAAQRDVEIDPHERFLALDIDVGYGLFIHAFDSLVKKGNHRFRRLHEFFSA
jgi:hypothetical protein